MITNETRAKLIHPDHRVVTIKGGYNEADRRVLTSQPDGPERLDMETVKSFAYSTDANAVAELRAFVRKRGKEVELAAVVFGKTCAGSVDVTWRELWAVLDATPQQICAAFDAVFKDELEKIQ